MSSFIIEGGRKLKDEILPQGAKNEAFQVICATVFTHQEVIIENIPEIHQQFAAECRKQA